MASYYRLPGICEDEAALLSASKKLIAKIGAGKIDLPTSVPWRFPSDKYREAAFKKLLRLDAKAGHSLLDAKLSAAIEKAGIRRSGLREIYALIPCEGALTYEVGYEALPGRRAIDTLKREEQGYALVYTDVANGEKPRFSGFYLFDEVPPLPFLKGGVAVASPDKTVSEKFLSGEEMKLAIDGKIPDPVELSEERKEVILSLYEGMEPELRIANCLLKSFRPKSAVFYYREDNQPYFDLGPSFPSIPIGKSEAEYVATLPFPLVSGFRFSVLVQSEMNDDLPAPAKKAKAAEARLSSALTKADPILFWLGVGLSPLVVAFEILYCLYPEAMPMAFPIALAAAFLLLWVDQAFALLYMRRWTHLPWPPFQAGRGPKSRFYEKYARMANRRRPFIVLLLVLRILFRASLLVLAIAFLLALCLAVFL